SVTARHTASTGWARWRSSRTAQRPPRASISSSRMSVLRVAVEVAFERVEVLLPQPAVRRQPGVDLRERLGAQLVASLLGLHVGADQAGLAQDLQVLRRLWLAEAQLVCELADRRGTGPQPVEDAAAGGLGDDVEE